MFIIKLILGLLGGLVVVVLALIGIVYFIARYYFSALPSDDETDISDGMAASDEGLQGDEDGPITTK